MMLRMSQVNTPFKLSMHNNLYNHHILILSTNRTPCKPVYYCQNKVVNSIILCIKYHELSEIYNSTAELHYL